MKTRILHLFLIPFLYLGAAHHVKAQTDSAGNKDIGITIPTPDPITPGTIELIGEVISKTSRDTTVCNRLFKNSMIIQVIEVIKFGSGITHVPNAPEKLIVSLVDQEYETFTASGREQLVVRELPCFGASGAVFQLLKYTQEN